MSPQLPVLVVRPVESFSPHCFEHLLQVGSGPTGLVAAISLTRNGIPVRIIEKRDSFHGGVRGTGLMVRHFPFIVHQTLFSRDHVLNSPEL